VCFWSPYLFGHHTFLLLDAVRVNKATKTASNCDVDNIIKEWLRTSSDRGGGRRQREKIRSSTSELGINQNSTGVMLDDGSSNE
jgi:hypothetical protein